MVQEGWMKGDFDCFKKQINEYNFSNVGSVHYVRAVDKTDEAEGFLCNPFFTRDHPEVQQQIVRKCRQYREDFPNALEIMHQEPIAGHSIDGEFLTGHIVRKWNSTVENDSHNFNEYTLEAAAELAQQTIDFEMTVKATVLDEDRDAVDGQSAPDQDAEDAFILDDVLKDWEAKHSLVINPFPFS